MKKYLWIVLFFVTTLCFAQPNAAINQSSTDNNLVIQLVDSKLVNLDNKIAAVAQINQAGIADLKARTDEKLADKFKQLDDKGVYVGWWLNVLAIWLTLIGILAPIGAFLLSRKIDKNIKESQELLDKETKSAADQVENKLQEADRLINQIRDNHKKSQELTEQQEEMRKTPPKEVNEGNKQKIKEVSDILAENPESQLTANDWFIKGLNAQEQKEYYEAITYYNHAIKLNPNVAMYYNNRGAIKGELQQHEEAIKDFDIAIKLDPNDAKYRSNRGVAKIWLKQYEEAVKDFDMAITLDPNDAAYYYSRGTVRAKLKLYDDAIKGYDKAIELDPKHVGAYFNKACAYALMKNKPESLSWLEKALQLDYSVADVLKDEDWKIYLDDADFKILLAKYNK